MNAVAKPVDQSHVRVNKAGEATSFVGKDAVDLYRAMTLKMSISLWVKTKMIPTRGVTITRMLAMATGYTGKKYTPKKAAEAVEDIRIWAETMKAGMPIKREGEKADEANEYPAGE